MYSESELMSIICARTGIKLTDEQREFARDITVPTLSFSDPGTGKTATAVISMVFAQLHHKVPGNRINAMSYTKAATAEISARYSRTCAQCGIKPTATFNTFHSICYQILKEKFAGFKVARGIDYRRDLPILLEYMTKIDKSYANTDLAYIRRILEAINNLNSSLCFTEDKVKSSYAFKKLELDYDVFTQLRKRWFTLGLLSNKIVQGDIPLYALFCLLTDDALVKKYRERYKIMIVDEFQDLSVLSLKVLSLIAEVLVVIGDKKQQIYGFNGASPRIEEEYLKMYPEARTVSLTKSFRCKDEIAEFATDLVRPNDKEVETFTGMGTGGKIVMLPSSEMDLQDIVADIKAQNLYTEDSTEIETMFLYRNNVSITPIAEELYKQKVPFRVNRFKKVNELPMFGVMCRYIDVALNDRTMDTLKFLYQLFPEFKQYNVKTIETSPIILAIKQSRKGLLSVPYQFQEQSSYEIVEALRRIKKLNQEGAKASQLMSVIEGIYEKYIIEGKWWLLEYPKDFYYQIVSPITTTKTYKVMIKEEEDKLKKINNYIGTSMGVRCYTMHSAKGLEADIVYILDCDDGVFPNDKMMERYSKEGCNFEASLNLRNERNLLFVGITRAKDTAIIAYNGELSKLISTPFDTGYEHLDSFYKHNVRDEDDIPAFLALYNLNKGKE